MEAEFYSRSDTLFNYGSSCYAFAHNICRRKPEIPDGMPNPSVPVTAEFFANPRCPPSTSAAAPAPDAVVAIEEDCSTISPSTAGEGVVRPTDGEEAVLQTGGEEAILLIDPPIE